MARNKRFLGCQYPLVKTARGILAQKNGVEQIKSDLLQLLLTNPGERVMNPTFGTPLRRLIFEPNEPTLEIQAKNIIAESIRRWEPRIEINSIFVTSSASRQDLNPDDAGEDLEHVLEIKIEFFDPQNISEVQQLVLEVPIAGA